MCPDSELLSAYFDGEVASPWQGRVREHVASCQECQLRLKRLERLRELLRDDPEPALERAQERTRGELGARVWRSFHGGKPFWKTRVAVPLPAAAAALFLLVGMGVLLLIASIRPSLPWMSIRREPSGTTEVHVAAPLKDLETLIRSLDSPQMAQEIVITLPEESNFVLMGEPRMLRATDYREGSR
jgi:hypothetical protein